MHFLSTFTVLVSFVSVIYMYCLLHVLPFAPLVDFFVNKFILYCCPIVGLNLKKTAIFQVVYGEG